jgi:cell division protein FtsQ
VSGPSQPQGSPPAGMDPRISARRTEITRQLGRRRLRLVGALAVVTVAVVGGWALLHSSLFSARSITVVGAVHETAAQVVAAAGVADHPPLLDVDTGSMVHGIEQLPWVRSASVAVHWPDGVRIVVTERLPALVTSTTAGQWAELSTTGRVLTVVATRPPGLVVVTGPQPPGALGSLLGPLDQPGVQVADTLPASFRAQVSAVHVEPGGWVQLSLTTPLLVNVGTASQLDAKYEDVSALLAGASLHAGDVIDVSVPTAPTVTEG